MVSLRLHRSASPSSSPTVALTSKLARAVPLGDPVVPAASDRLDAQMDNGATYVMLSVAAFVMFGDPIVEAGFDWRSLVYDACVWITGS